MRGPGRENRDMQTARTHGFDLGRVGLARKNLDFLAGHFGTGWSIEASSDVLS